MLRPFAILLLLLWPALVLAGTTLAIPDLSDETGDPRLKGAGAGVASILVTRFAKLEGVQVVERARLAEVTRELDLGASGRVDPATAARAGKLLGADHLVLGSLTSIALPQVAIHLRVVETASGKVILAEDVRGDVGANGEQFFVLVDELAFRVTDALALKLTSRDRIALSQVEVERLNTVGVYGLAMQALDQGRNQEAERLLAEALAMEPGFRLAKESLDRVAVEVKSARASISHDAATNGLAALGRLEAHLQQTAPTGPPTLTAACHRGLSARLSLIRGDLPAAIAAEEARIVWTTEHIEALWVNRDYDPDCGTFVRDNLSIAQADDIKQLTSGVVFWPFEIRAELADLRFRLGQREAAIDLLIKNYQHPGPTGRFARGPNHPERTLERWGAVDMVVVLQRQNLEMARRGGAESEIKRAVTELDRTLASAEHARKALAAWTALQPNLAQRTTTVAGVRAETAAVKGITKQHDLLHAGYRAYLRRFEAGYYKTAQSTDPAAFRELAETWLKAADALWAPPRWAAEQPVQHLLTFQAQVPPTDDETRERYARQLDQRVVSAWR